MAKQPDPRKVKKDDELIEDINSGDNVQRLQPGDKLTDDEAAELGLELHDPQDD